MRRLVVLFLMFGLAGTAGAGKLPKGLWKSLLTQGAKWTLPYAGQSFEGREDTPDSMVVEVTEVRKVGTADVVQLEWSVVIKGKAEAGTNSFNPVLLAISKKGVYVLSTNSEEKLEDAAITKRLKKKPTYTDPAKASNVYKRKDGFFVVTTKSKKGTVCYGGGAEDATCGAAPCYSYICLDATGIVGIGGIGDSGDVFGFAPPEI